MVSTDKLAWSYCCNHLMACVDRPRIFLQNIHNHVCTTLYNVLTQTTLWILSTVSTSNTVPKTIMNSKVNGKVTLGKLNYRRAVYIVTQYLISHTCSTNCVHCYILRLKKLRKQTIFIINSYFVISTTYVEFQASTTIIPQENLTADYEIKQHILQWKDNEDCSRIAVNYAILIIWVTVATTWNEAQLFNWSVIIIKTIPQHLDVLVIIIIIIIYFVQSVSQKRNCI
jgi:hypothetical protein